MACAALALAVAFGHLDEKGRARLAHAAAIPLVASMVGLVASATHLGTPANALYALTGVGRSPLSNEVACTVAFLTPGGLHWLYSFSLHVHRGLQQAWCAAVAASGVAGAAIVRGRRRNARPSGTALGVASLAYLAGLFAVRFGFYMTHMTVGIG